MLPLCILRVAIGKMSNSTRGVRQSCYRLSRGAIVYAGVSMGLRNSIPTTPRTISCRHTGDLNGAVSKSSDRNVPEIRSVEKGNRAYRRHCSTLRESQRNDIWFFILTKFDSPMCMNLYGKRKKG